MSIDRGHESTPTSILDIDLDNNIDLPQPIMDPFVDSTIHLHKNWVFCRIYSEDVHRYLKKHFDTFQGNYLSQLFLGEIFHNKVSQDENVDYGPTMDFQAVQVKKKHDICINKVTGQQELFMDAVVVTTANNFNLTLHKKNVKKTVQTVDSLAELMKTEVEVGDYLLTFGIHADVIQNTIDLNWKHRDDVLIVVYRHDGVFSHPVEKDSENILIKFDRKRFNYVVVCHDTNESLLRIKSHDAMPVVTCTVSCENEKTPIKCSSKQQNIAQTSQDSQNDDPFWCSSLDSVDKAIAAIPEIRTDTPENVTSSPDEATTNNTEPEVPLVDLTLNDNDEEESNDSIQELGADDLYSYYCKKYQLRAFSICLEQLTEIQKSRSQSKVASHHGTKRQRISTSPQCQSNSKSKGLVASKHRKTQKEERSPSRSSSEKSFKILRKVENTLPLRVTPPNARESRSKAQKRRDSAQPKERVYRRK